MPVNSLMSYLKRQGTSATPQRIASGFCLGVLCVTLGSLVAATLAHEFQVLRSSRLGNPYAAGAGGVAVRATGATR